MITVKINGEDSNFAGANLERITDLIEFIKANIDPDKIIVGLTINGKPLTEDMWFSSPNSYSETDILEVQVGTREEFVRERMNLAPNLIENTYILFRSARQSFRAGDAQEANQILCTAINDLRAFFEWYALTLQVLPPEESRQLEISDYQEKILNVCRELSEVQSTQSWWALADSIQNKLEPALDELETHLRRKSAELSRAVAN